MGKIVISLLFYCFTLSVFATNYYVANSGNDSNNGLTPETAWKTLEKVRIEAAQFKPGDIIAFKGGDEFYGKLYIWDINGVSGNPITITSYGSGKAIIKGTKEITNWSSFSAGIYEANIPQSDVAYHLLINNIAQTNGRVPKLIGKHATSNNFFKITSKTNSKTFRCSELIGLPSLVGATVHMQGEPWAMEAKKIASFNSSTGEVTIENNVTFPFKEGSLFFINNHIDLLDQQNEWHYNSQSKKIYVRSDMPPSNVSISTLNDDNFVLDNCSFVVIDNIHVLGSKKTGIWLSNSNDIKVQNTTIEYTGKFGISADVSSNISLDNNKIKGTTRSAISLTSANSLITNNYISEISLMQNFSYTGGGGTNINGGIVSRRTSVIKNNIVEDTGSSGLSVFGINTLIENNYIKNTCLTAHDGGAIYTYDWSSNPADGLKIKNNIIINEVNLSGNWSSHGIYCDDNSKNVTVEGNSVAGFALNIFSHNNKQNKFKNNKLYKSIGEGILIKNDQFGGEAKDNIVTDNEIYLEKDDEAPMRVQNALGSSFVMASYDKNKFYNPILNESVKVITTSISNMFSLSDWQNLSNQDENSVEDDLVWDNNSLSKFVFNETQNTKSFSLNGNWWDLSGNKYAGSIVLQPYTSSILVNQEIEKLIGSIDANAGSDQTICRGENIILTASGGTSYVWSTGETTANITVNPTETSTYTVTVSNGTDSDSDEVVVTVNQAPNVDAGEDVEICFGENMTLTATGTGNFLWSTGETTASITVSPTVTTIYTVTASNSCATDATDEIIITVNDLPVVDAGSNVTIESGSNAVLIATGEGNFLWSTGETTPSITVSPSQTTSYTVTVTSEDGCSTNDNVVVTVENSGGNNNNDPNQVTAYAGVDEKICVNSSVTLTASGGDNYLWSTGETTASITVSPTETTIYTVTVSNGNSIDVDDVTVIVDETCSGINNRLNEKESKLYPNPTEGVLNIELINFSYESVISIFDLNGRLVYSKIVDNYSPVKIFKCQLNLSNFAKGIYYVKLSNSNYKEAKKVLVH